MKLHAQKKAVDCYSEIGINIAYDSFKRFLTRQSLTKETLLNKVEKYVENTIDWFVLDDTIIEKFTPDSSKCYFNVVAKSQDRKGHWFNKSCVDIWIFYISHKLSNLRPR